MKMIKTLSFCALALLLFSCGSETKQESAEASLDVISFNDLSEKIEANNNAISEAEDATVLIPLANNQVLLCETFSVRFGDDEHAAEYVYWGAKAARAAQRANKAIKMYDIIINKYPSYEKAPEAMFLKGFIYDEDLNDKEKAKAAYEALIGKFPTHRLAKDAAVLMEQLYMTDDELIDFLKQKEEVAS